MTTVAATATQIAWDSQATYGNLRGKAAMDKVVRLRGKIYGVCGDIAACVRLPKWHAAGAKPRLAPDGEWTMLVIGPKGVAIYTHDNPTGMPVHLPVAIGSGMDFAMGALHAGKTAQEAVEIAAKLDVYTGGTINQLDVVKALAAAKPKRRVRHVRKVAR